MASDEVSNSNADAQPEWFAKPRGGDRPGLRFACTQCGNCCTGPEGYVLISPAEQTAFAAHLGVSESEFVARYTKETILGRSLAERQTTNGLDCIFLDRSSIPGKAICGAYAVRPVQCRTWPFWSSNLTDEAAWKRAGRNCPGIDRAAARLYTPVQIRVDRDRVKI